MNAVTADEVIYVPLSKLRVSEKNVRKKGDLSIEQLAAQIHAEGLLQNLVVTQATKGMYEIVDGKRRYLAMQHLSKGMLLDLDREVAVKVVDASHATSASLSAAFSQLPLHPVDQFDAFQALVDEGKSAPEIAAAFGIQERAVLQSLRLASVARPIVEAYRNDEISMNVLQAFTLSDDKERQLQAFKSLPKYGHDDFIVREVRNQLTKKEVSLISSPLAKLVGVDAYEAAGGATRKDMFSADVYFADAGLVQRIADSRVAELEHRVRAEGWSWVQVKLEGVHLYSYQVRKPKIAPTTPEQDQELARIAERKVQLGKELAQLRRDEPEYDGSADYIDWENSVPLREQDHARLTVREGEIQAERSTWSARTLAEAGAIVSLTAGGQLIVHRGLIDEKTAKRLAKAKAAKGAAAVVDGASTNELPEISDALHQRLTAYRSSVIRRQLQLNTTAMLAVLAHSLARGTFGYRGWYGEVTTISASPTDSDHANAGVDMDEFTPHLNLSLDRSHAVKDLPDDSVPALAELLKWSEADLLDLIGSCVATSFSGIYGKGGNPKGERGAMVELLATHLEIDMRDYWHADRERYLAHVPKALVIQAVTEAKGAAAAKSLATMGKLAAAESAEILLDDQEWLPAIFRRPEQDSTKPKPTTAKKTRAAKATSASTNTQQVSQEEAVAHIQGLLEAKRQREAEPSSWPSTPEAAPIVDKARPKLKAPTATKVTGKKAAIKKAPAKKAAVKKVAKA